MRAGAAREAARRFGTPLYLYDLGRLRDDARTVRHAFPDPWLRLYSLKANGLPGLVREVAAEDFGANAVSGGEWLLARRAGLPEARIALSGIGKTERDLAAAVRAARDGRPLLWTSLESADEARALARLARRASGRGRPGGRASFRLDVLIRLNPAVTPETAAVLAVGAPGSKFGVLAEELPDVIEAGGGPDGPLRWRGLHVHVGSQLGAVDAWRAAIRRALPVLALSGGTLEGFDTLDCGGGFPVAWPGDPAPPPEHFAREAAEALAALPLDRQPARLAIEPGRAVVARAGWLVARVLHVRERTVREPAIASEAPPREEAVRQVVLDAGMTELIRPALYGARHPVVALTSLGRAVDPADESEAGAWEVRLEGSICESTDTFGLHPLPALRRGDLVVVAQAGAYASSMASTYNGRPRPPEVALDGGALRPLRRRGRAATLP